MEVKIKKLCDNAVIPFYAKDGDAGMDLTATSRFFDEYGSAVYGFGLAFEIPKGYVGLIFPRSSIYKTDLSLSNSVGVIDSGYRGEVMAKFKPTLVYANNSTKSFSGNNYDFVYAPSENRCNAERARLYEVGDKIAQMIIIPIPNIEFKEVNDLSESERGNGGFGSTDK